MTETDKTPTDGTDEDELQFLLDLYQRIGARLCEHLGHDWETVSSESTANTIQFDRCSQCNETRKTPNQFGTTTREIARLDREVVHPEIYDDLSGE